MMFEKPSMEMIELEENEIIVTSSGCIEGTSGGSETCDGDDSFTGECGDAAPRTY